ncbi:hypothetical protein HD806DRAFT_512594 [Xylariaceae sp. AK1471]|nr:hypothetical protein HD806DRAFT_512594 [Xylariaceae sp. AK1471]
MCQRRQDRFRDVRGSSQGGGDDEETYSNKATSGSSDLGSDDLASMQTRSQSSERGLQRPMTRRLRQELQADQKNRLDASNPTIGISPLISSSFRGLTPDPLPSAMLPDKKRSLDEMLHDKTPPQNDKMSAEIDQLAEEGPPHSYILQAGPSETQNVEAHQSHQWKRSRASGGSSTHQVLPDRTSDGRGDRPPERRSERIRNAARHGGRGTSDSYTRSHGPFNR